MHRLHKQKWLPTVCNAVLFTKFPFDSISIYGFWTCSMQKQRAGARLIGITIWLLLLVSQSEESIHWAVNRQVLVKRNESVRERNKIGWNYNRNYHNLVLGLRVNRRSRLLIPQIQQNMSRKKLFRIGHAGVFDSQTTSLRFCENTANRLQH